VLKFFELEARFPRDRAEIPPAAVAFVADQVAVAAGELAVYDCLRPPEDQIDVEGLVVVAGAPAAGH
jgi:hypothetical protein